VVTEKGRCVGIVTERDLIERTICEQRSPDQTPVGDIMSSKIKTIHGLAKLEDAIEMMQQYNIKKLPVILNEQIAGIITVTDISRARPEVSKRFMESWVIPKWQD
jgi:CBS domain-containing protein